MPGVCPRSAHSPNLPPHNAIELSPTLPGRLLPNPSQPSPLPYGAAEELLPSSGRSGNGGGLGAGHLAAYLAPASPLPLALGVSRTKWHCHQGPRGGGLRGWASQAEEVRGSNTNDTVLMALD